jgi:phospholipid/cholesterol/gamma-HCH transport system ATP-binding protein
MSESNHLEIRNLCMSYGDNVIQRNLDFDVRRGEIFAIMGGSGCGKSTLLRHLVGLMAPASGDIFFGGINLWKVSESKRQKLISRAGVLYQGGALWSSMTLYENIALPLREYSRLSEAEITAVVNYKLALVGLAGFAAYYPSEISGGMRKRAGLARAIALDPDILFFDEPSAGLDPVSSKRLDELIMLLRDSLGATIVIVSHELASIFDIADNSIFLDPDVKTIIASGPPKELLKTSMDRRVLQFLQRSTV